MEKHQEKQIKDLINALQILGFKRNEDNNFLPLHINRAISNPFKLSYILKNNLDTFINSPEGYTKEEIKALKSLTKKDAKISDEFREKFFKATNIEKFFRLYFQPFSNDTEANLFSNIIEKFKLQFFGEMKFLYKARKGEEIAQVYADTLPGFKVLHNGSCMQGKEIEWFEIYTKCKGLEIITLQIDTKIVARALLWYDTENENYYLDKIYICNEFDDNTKEKLQAFIYTETLKKKKLRILNCATRIFILRHLRTDKQKNEKAIAVLNDSTKDSPENNFCINVNGGHFDYYPYADTMKNYQIGTDNKSFLHYDYNADVYLDSTEGGQENEECAGCGDYFHEDEITYSDLEDCYICNDCEIYLEDREETCLDSNAIYDNYRSVYLYRADIDH